MNTSRKPDPENSPEDNSETRRQSIVPIAPLPEHISQNIETIIALQTRNEQDVSGHQRGVEAVTTFFGRPAFLYTILLVIVLWMTPNILPRRFGLPRFDPPPIAWLGFWVTTGSLLMTAGVLIKQNRQEKLAEQRAQLIKPAIRAKNCQTHWLGRRITPRPSQCEKSLRPRSRNDEGTCRSPCGNCCAGRDINTRIGISPEPGNI